MSIKRQSRLFYESPEEFRNDVNCLINGITFTVDAKQPVNLTIRTNRLLVFGFIEIQGPIPNLYPNAYKLPFHKYEIVHSLLVGYNYRLGNVKLDFILTSSEPIKLEFFLEWETD